jgi:hypothetical protein
MEDMEMRVIYGNQIWRLCSRYVLQFLSTRLSLQRLSSAQMVYTQSILYHLSIALVKASFALQYLRLFSLIRPLTYTCYLLLALVLGAATWAVFGVVFLCDPIRSYWDLRVPGTCGNAEDHFFSTSVVGIFLDWAIWILPIPVVNRLNLPRRQRMGLLAVFGLGGM